MRSCTTQLCSPRFKKHKNKNKPVRKSTLTLPLTPCSSSSTPPPTSSFRVPMNTSASLKYNLRLNVSKTENEDFVYYSQQDSILPKKRVLTCSSIMKQQKSFKRRKNDPQKEGLVVRIKLPQSPEETPSLC